LCKQIKVLFAVHRRKCCFFIRLLAIENPATSAITCIDNRNAITYSSEFMKMVLEVIKNPAISHGVCNSKAIPTAFGCNIWLDRSDISFILISKIRRKRQLYHRAIAVFTGAITPFLLIKKPEEERFVLLPVPRKNLNAEILFNTVYISYQKLL